MRLRNLLLLMTLMALTLSFPALAQDEDKTEVFTTTYDPATSAHYRIAHFVPDAEAVDVYVDGELSGVKGFTYPNVSDWMTIPAGAHTITIAPAGETEDAALLEPLTLNLSATNFYTIVLLGSVADATLSTQVLEPDMSELTPGTARVTFLQAIDKGESIGFYRDEVPFTTGFSYGDTYTEVVDSGDHLFQAVTGGESPDVLAEAEDIDIRENRSYIIAAVGQAGTSGATAPQLVIVPTNFADYAMASGALPQPGTVVQAIQAEDLTGDLSDALVAADLVETLEGEGPFTVFAPAELSLDDFNSKDPSELAAILQAHVVDGELLSQDLAEGASLVSLAGTPIEIGVDGNGFSVNGVPVLTVNIPASNGVVHLIGEPLLTEAPANG